MSINLNRIESEDIETILCELSEDYNFNILSQNKITYQFNEIQTNSFYSKLSEFINIKSLKLELNYNKMGDEAVESLSF